MKRTFEKYVEMARQMRSVGGAALDIRNLSPHEAYIVTALVKEDAIFNFFDKCKDIDVGKLRYAVEMLEAKEKYEKSMVI